MVSRILKCGFMSHENINKVCVGGAEKGEDVLLAELWHMVKPRSD